MYKLRIKNDVLPSYFPLTMTCSLQMPPTGEHSHDCTEIGIITQGEALHLCNGESRRIHPGDVLILYPDQLHSFPETENLSMYNVLFRRQELNIPQYDLVKFPRYQEIFMPEESGNMPGYRIFHLTPADFKHLRVLLKLMKEEQKNIGRTGFRSAIMGLFMNMLCHLLRSFSAADENELPGSYEQNIDTAVNYLKKHYLEPFDLDYLLKISAMSRSNFMKRFRAVTGSAPKQFVLRKRIAYAARRIATSEIQLSEIALECGFCDSSHFSKVFQQLTSESPSTYRKRVAQHSDRETSWNKYDIENPFVEERMS